MSTPPYPVTSVGFWRAYAVTLRPYLFFVSGAAGLVGLALTRVPPLRLLAAFGAFFLSYGLGQALTDVSQRDTDALSAPYRPLVRGEITPSAVVGVSLAGLAACSTLFWALAPRTLLLAAAAVAGLATYTPLKRHWWGGPAWNSWIVALLPAIGVQCGGGVVTAALVEACASVFFTYAVFVILGYLKDVEADRATGYVTLPVRFGRSVAVGASAACLTLGAGASVSLVSSSTSAAPHVERTLAALLWAAGLALLVLAHARLAGVTRDADAHGGIALSVRGFVALHAGEAALLRPGLAVPALVFVAVLDRALAARPCREQV